VLQIIFNPLIFNFLIAHSVIGSQCIYKQTIFKQEAQLSQRDRATLRVIEYFAKSLKIIGDD